ncbi:hypothetical protein RF11_00996 [Thelohanellus kitauei]|uniref:Uncharacterized protein n=1 Tax=Thelohanellus kitauei TaxID=669202 RepID=A0A0C2MS69_THEKT|nr:hypothetical protein RF11_00996 [Thelohanellus kitauei]
MINGTAPPNNFGSFNKTPVILKYKFVDENDHIEVAASEHVHDFVIYYTKGDINTGKGAIYRYDNAKHAFVSVTFNIRGMIVKSFDKVIPTGRKMWCISRVHKIAFYIKKDFSFEGDELIEPDAQYAAHPEFSDLIIKYTANKVSPINFQISTSAEYFFKSFSLKTWQIKTEFFFAKGDSFSLFNMKFFKLALSIPSLNRM